MEGNSNNYGTLGSTPPPQQFASGSFFTPLIIAMLGIVVTSLVIVAYHILLVKYCAHRARLRRLAFNQSLQDRNAKREDGVKEHVLKTIPIIAYSEVKRHIFQYDSECMICLGELEDEDMVRLLPNCRHTFHVPCIDQWFLKHSSCPICRSTVIVVDNPVILGTSPLSSQPLARDLPGPSSGLLQHPRMGLRRSLSMDPYLVLNVNEYLGEVRKLASASRSCGSSGSCSSQGADLLQSRSMKHMECMSSRLMRSFSQRFKVGRNNNVNTILPY